MLRKFLALLGLLVGLSVMLPPTLASARVYNQEIADATNAYRARHDLSEVAATRIQADWPLGERTPLVTRTTPSIWAGMKARLEALEAAGETDSATRVAQAISPAFVFPASVQAKPVIAARTPQAAEPATRPVAPPVAAVRPTEATQAAEKHPVYGTARTIFTPFTEMLRSAWYWLAYEGWGLILAAFCMFVAVIIVGSLTHKPAHPLARADNVVPDSDEESEPEPLLLTDKTELLTAQDPTEPGGDMLQPSILSPGELTPAEPLEPSLSPTDDSGDGARGEFGEILALIRNGPGEQEAGQETPPPQRARVARKAATGTRHAAPPAAPAPSELSPAPTSEALH